MYRYVPHIIFFAFALIVSTRATVSAQAVDAVTGTLKRAGITEKIGELVALEAEFLDEEGNTVSVGDYFDGERPVVLTFVYHECPMLCSMVLEALTKAMRDLDWRPGEEYRAVTVSISPSETPELALRQKERYVGRLNDPEAGPGWSFLTGSKEDIAAMAASAGFDFEQDAESGEYGHAATVIFVSPSGVVTRYLYGISYDPFDVRAALVEASEGTLGNVADRFIMFCYQYDPVKGSYVPHAWLAMRLAAGFTLALLVGLLAVLWMRERSHSESSSVGANQEGADE